MSRAHDYGATPPVMLERCLCGHSRLAHRHDGECGVCDRCAAFTPRAGARVRDAITVARRVITGHRGRRGR